MGRRFRLNDEARELGLNVHRNSPQVGTIIGEGVGGVCWRVRFDGRITPKTIHKSFIDIEESP